VADVFISYAKEAKAETERLAQELQARGLSVWYDTSLVAGDNFGEVIMSELAQARAVIVVWDAASVKSEWVRSEASRARARRILIPVRAEGIRSHDIPPPFDSLHTELLSNRAGIDAALAKLGIAPSATAPSGTPAAAHPVLALPDKPSIAVLPFINMTGTPDQEYFGDGIAEDIINMLSRSRSLFVIGRNSSFTYKGRAVPVKQIGRELGVRYVLEGSVRHGGKRVRISAELVDAETGNHVWGEKYDRDPSDVFAVQDEITEAVATAIEPAIAQIERHSAVRKAPESLGAWEAYQRGLWHLGLFSVTENETAKLFLRRAIELDPNFAPAYAWLSAAIFYGTQLYQTTSLLDASTELMTLALRAVSLDPLDPFGHLAVGLALWVRGDNEGVVAKAREALAINPNFSSGHALSGAALINSGRSREGIDAFQRSLRLDPNDPGTYQRLSAIAQGQYFLRDYPAAIDAARSSLRSYGGHPNALRWLAAALGQAGRLEEAKQALQDAIAVAPKSFDMYVRQRVPWMRPEDYEHMLEGLRKAGWEG
jgi:adenylate cyclase